MKKFIAILLSVLMLCTLIPFATVAAADEPYVEIYVEETELNAGDEFEVSVNLIGNPGVTGAKVELLFDTDVFEVVTYYDEDEEDDFNMIEVAAKWNASSNKYIQFGPLGKCSVMYLRADAKQTQMRTEELFYTVTMKVKDDAASGNYELTANIGEQDFICNVFGADGTAVPGQFDIIAFGLEAATITVNGSEPTPPACEHEYNYDCDKICKLCGQEIRPEAEHSYDNEFDADCNICGGTREAVAFPINHVGNSAMEMADGKGGLAMSFSMDIAGIAIKENTWVWADYTNATYNGNKLLEIGVVASNGTSEATIKGERMYDLEGTVASFAFRITNVPSDKGDVVVTMIPYFIVEIDGVATTFYGEAQTATYNETIANN